MCSGRGNGAQTKAAVRWPLPPAPGSRRQPRPRGSGPLRQPARVRRRREDPRIFRVRHQHRPEPRSTASPASGPPRRRAEIVNARGRQEALAWTRRRPRHTEPDDGGGLEPPRRRRPAGGYHHRRRWPQNSRQRRQAWMPPPPTPPPRVRRRRTSSLRSGGRLVGRRGRAVVQSASCRPRALTISGTSASGPEAGDAGAARLGAVCGARGRSSGLARRQACGLAERPGATRRGWRRDPRRRSRRPSDCCFVCAPSPRPRAHRALAAPPALRDASGAPGRTAARDRRDLPALRGARGRGDPGRRTEFQVCAADPWTGGARGAVAGRWRRDHRPERFRTTRRAAGSQSCSGGRLCAGLGGISSLQLSLPLVWTVRGRRGFASRMWRGGLCEAPAKLAGWAVGRADCPGYDGRPRGPRSRGGVVVEPSRLHHGTRSPVHWVHASRASADDIQPAGGVRAGGFAPEQAVDG